MKIILTQLLLFCSYFLIAQKIDVPKGVVYKYCDSSVYLNALDKINIELSSKSNYSLNLGITFIGPVLWQRIKSDKNLSEIKGGDMTITAIDRKNPTGKMTQNENDFKLVWDYIRKEVADKKILLRKATPKELQYYWAVISFDIEEPLIIAETDEHRYILNLDPSKLKLIWLDEVPKNY
jgi:hypothetical protein